MLNWFIPKKAKTAAANNPSASASVPNQAVSMTIDMTPQDLQKIKTEDLLDFNKLESDDILTKYLDENDHLLTSDITVPEKDQTPTRHIQPLGTINNNVTNNNNFNPQHPFAPHMFSPTPVSLQLSRFKERNSFYLGQLKH